MEPLLFGIGLFVFVGVLFYALKTTSHFTNTSARVVQEYDEAREEA